MCEVADVVMMGFLGIASYTDIKRKEVSVRMLVGITVFAILAAILCKKELLDVLGGVGIGGMFFLISKCTREQIGYGDSWLILALGIYVGSKKLITILFAASFGAALFSLCFCAVHKWNRRYAVPFIPFLAAAFVGVVFL